MIMRPRMVASMSDGRPLSRGAVACRRKRRAKKWSQAELAERAKTTQPTVARWEAGIQKPQAGQRLELVELLELDWRLWDQPAPVPA